MRRPWPGPLGIVLTLLAAVLLSGLIIAGSFLNAHTKCGGTFGGYGGAPDDNLDRACLRRKQDDHYWAVLFTWGVAVGGIVYLRWTTSPDRDASPLAGERKPFYDD